MAGVGQSVTECEYLWCISYEHDTFFLSTENSITNPGIKYIYCNFLI